MLLQNTYYDGRVVEQGLANGDVYRYDYLPLPDGEIVRTTVSGPKGAGKFFFKRGILSREE